MVEVAKDSTPNILLGGRYRPLERIGQGAKGTVYRARDEFLGRDVAAKLIRTAALDEDQQRRDDDEVKMLARLNHHSLISLLDAGSDLSDPASPRVYLVMELIRGLDLQKRSGRERCLYASSRRSGTTLPKAWTMSIANRWFTGTSSPPTSCCSTTAPMMRGFALS